MNDVFKGFAEFQVSKVRELIKQWEEYRDKSYETYRDLGNSYSGKAIRLSKVDSVVGDLVCWVDQHDNKTEKEKEKHLAKLNVIRGHLDSTWKIYSDWMPRFPYDPELNKLDGIFEHSDFILYGHKVHKLRMQIQQIEDESNYFRPKFLPLNEQGKSILKVIKTRGDLASLVSTYADRDWFQDLLIWNLHGGKLRGGRASAVWADRIDVVGVFLCLKKRFGFRPVDIYQFIAERLEVTGCDEIAHKDYGDSYSDISKGADAVRKYIKNNKNQWYVEYFPEHSTQSEMQKRTKG